LTPESTGPKPEHWGLLSGFPGDCKFTHDGAALLVGVPGTLHIFNTGVAKNPPELVTDAGGDFTATVRVTGKMSPGNVPLDLPAVGPKPKDKKKIPKFPITFHGAGLLVRQDEKNFIRLERTSQFVIESGKRAHIVLFEYYKNGALSSDESRPVRTQDADLTLKFERKGANIRCSYSPDDGKNWIDVKRLQNVSLPPTVKVGVSASNVSAKPLNARFENFELGASTP
jgi:regulation of enolase protein 1 (concanavalin A-like superfamily)